MEIVGFTAVITAGVIIWRVLDQVAFSRQPVGKRCRVNTGEGWEKGEVMQVSSFVLSEYIVKLDTGGYHIAEKRDMKPVLWEI